MELLRIISMSMILIHHFLVHSLTPGNIPYHLFYAVNPLVYSGVTIFFLLSGYFRIKFSLRSLIRFASILLVFGLANILLIYLCGNGVSFTEVISTIVFPITRSPYWFIRVYLFLLITSPILNAGLESLNRLRLRNTLLLLLFFVFIGTHSLATFSYLHGVYLYCVGYYFRRYQPFSYVRSSHLLACFFLLCIIPGVINWSLHPSRIADGYINTYKSVFIFLSGCSLFLYFTRLSFRSALINSIASASLGCYLLQDGLFGSQFFYEYQGAFFKTHGYGWSLLGMFAASFLAFWIVSYLITRIINSSVPEIAEKASNSLHGIANRIEHLLSIPH